MRKKPYWLNKKKYRIIVQVIRKWRMVLLGMMRMRILGWDIKLIID